MVTWRGGVWTCRPSEPGKEGAQRSCACLGRRLGGVCCAPADKSIRPDQDDAVATKTISVSAPTVGVTESGSTEPVDVEPQRQAVGGRL